MISWAPLFPCMYNIVINIIPDMTTTTPPYYEMENQFIKYSKKKKKKVYIGPIWQVRILYRSKKIKYMKKGSQGKDIQMKKKDYIFLFFIWNANNKGEKKKCSNANDFSWHPPPPLSFSSLIIHTQLHTIDDCCPTNIIQQSFISPFFPPLFQTIHNFFQFRNWVERPDFSQTR